MKITAIGIERLRVPLQVQPAPGLGIELDEDAVAHYGLGSA